jgi:hypothetical protein
MIEVTLKYGLTRQLTVEVSENASLRSIIANANYRASLGYPENVSAVIDGNTANLDDTLCDGDVVLLEKQAAAKAA